MDIKELREAVLQTCFVREDSVFASGVAANNKLDVERLHKNPDLSKKVIQRIGKLAIEDAPDFVVGVPNGANWLAERVADLTKLNLVVLQADSDKNISYADKHSEYIAEYGFRGVMIEDVFNRFTNSRKVLGFESLANKISLAVSVWDRGNPNQRTQLEIPHKSLVTEYIPSQLGSDSELWRYST